MKKNKFKQEYLWGYLFILPNFIGFMIFLAVPIVIGFIYSLTSYNGFNQFNFVGLDNYINMFKDEYFLVSLKNNLIYTMLSVPATIALALMLAVILNSRVWGGSYFKTVFFFPTITSMVAVGIVWSVLFNPQQGPINNFLRSIGIIDPPLWLASTKTALLSVIIVAVWKSTGYYMVMILAGLQTIPESLYESANIDGANFFRKFWSITLPMLSPTMFLVTILSIINSFQVFDLISVMTNGGPGRATNVLVYRIYQEGFVYLRHGYASAMAYFLFFIILIITMIQFRGQKKWVSYMQ